MTRKKEGLGRSLTKNRTSRNRNQNSSFLHTTDLPDGSDWARLNLRSVTEQNDLEEFLSTAELAGTEFIAEKANITVINSTTTHGILSDSEKKALKELHQKHQHYLRIPRRPPWEAGITPEELNQFERESFLTWRRQLAEVQETEGIVLTPYEKNLEFWRQLWRVIERSDVIVQIVDARNPMLFYCEDLEKYVSEVNPDKMSVLMLNKSDFLTPAQRDEWAKYLASVGIRAVFFSALDQIQELEENSSEEKEDEETEVTSEVHSDSHQSVCDSENADSSKGKIINSPHLLSKDELLSYFKAVHSGPKVKDGMVTIGLVGYPNVGKSSTINALLRSKRVSVSKTPGKTKHFQTLMVEEDLCLCDCPGLVFPNFVNNKAEMIVNGILPIDQMKDHVPPVNLVVSVIPRHVLEKIYGIIIPKPHEGEDPQRSPTVEESLNAYGYMRGFMTQRGLPDNPRSSRYILKDFVNGKLLYCVAPPGACQKTYHTYPEPPDRNKDVVPPQMKMTGESKITGKDIDKAFFQKNFSQVHSKGHVGPMKLSEAQAMSVGKPWKKHHNNNKREKLRRVYNEHDA